MGVSTSDFTDDVIWIIGASSGIGAALAHELAGLGAKLILSSRRQDRLDELHAALGGGHYVFALDVTDAAALQQTARSIDGLFGRIDRVIFLAAAYEPMRLDNLDLAKVTEIISSNLIGAFHVIHAILPIIERQNSVGQIALCGSVAGYLGLPGGQPYSATKAAMINLAESLYVETKGLVDVKLISPGFVRTQLTAKNSFTMPMMIEPDQAAKYIAKGLLSSRFEIHFPRKFTLALKLWRVLPYRLSLYLMGKIRV